MSNETKSFKDVSEGLRVYLKQLSYSDGRIQFYQRGSRLIFEFMEKEGLDYYNSEVCSRYVASIVGTATYNTLAKKQKDLMRVATALIEYQTTGAITYRCTHKNYELSGEIGTSINEFLIYRRLRNFSEDTLESNHLYLSRFQAYLESKGINKFSQLNQNIIMSFINSLSFYSKATIHCTLCSLCICQLKNGPIINLKRGH